MSLLAPLFLLGLGMIALPLWLHRIQTQTPEREPFSSSMLLEASEQRLHMRKQLRFLLLLALRILLLALLAFAFAKPILKTTREIFAGDEPALQLIVIDTSFSMATGNRLDQALDIAGSIIDGLKPGQQAQIITADNHVRVLGDPGNDAGKLKNSLAAINTGNTRLDFGTLMNSLNGLLDNYKYNTAIHLISDFQASALPPRFADLVPRPEENRQVELILHPVIAQATENWAVSSVLTDKDSLRVTVRGYHTTKQDKTLTLTVNNAVQDRQTLTIPASGMAIATFAKPKLAKGDNRIQVDISPSDQLAADDRHYSVLENNPPTPVLLLAARADSLAVTYLKTALETGSYIVQTVNPDELDPRVLQRYPWIVVADLGAINPVLSKALAEYLNNGGAVLAAVGERAQGLTTLPVINQPVKSAALPGNSQFRTVARIDTSHPVLAKSPGWRSVNISRVIVPETDNNDRVLITLEGGDPLLLERHVGSGRILLLTTGLDNNWSDLPIHSVFVSFMTESARYLANEDLLERQHLAGDSILLLQAGGASGQVIDPAGHNVLTLADTQKTRNVELDHTGFYEVFTPGQDRLIAVNPDPRESETDLIDANMMARWRASGKPQPGGTSPAATGVEPVSRELWHGLLLLLVLIVLAESILGNRYLDYRTGQ